MFFFFFFFSVLEVWSPCGKLFLDGSNNAENSCKLIRKGGVSAMTGMSLFLCRLVGMFDRSRDQNLFLSRQNIGSFDVLIQNGG